MEHERTWDELTAEEQAECNRIADEIIDEILEEERQAKINSGTIRVDEQS